MYEKQTESSRFYQLQQLNVVVRWGGVQLFFGITFKSSPMLPLLPPAHCDLSLDDTVSSQHHAASVYLLQIYKEYLVFMKQCLDCKPPSNGQESSWAHFQLSVITPGIIFA